MSVGQWESRRIGEQTRKGLAAARATRGKTGRPAVEDVPHLKERIAAMRAEGMTLQAIADKLNEEGVPTLRGGSQWRPSSVQAAAGYRRPKKGPPGAEGRNTGRQAPEMTKAGLIERPQGGPVSAGSPRAAPRSLAKLAACDEHRIPDGNTPDP